MGLWYCHTLFPARPRAPESVYFYGNFSTHQIRYTIGYLPFLTLIIYHGYKNSQTVKKTKRPAALWLQGLFVSHIIFDGWVFIKFNDR